MARTTFSIPNRSIPAQGGIGVAVNFDFTATQTINSDLALEQMTNQIDYVQSIFIDNRLNAQPFTIAFSGLNMTWQVRGGRQGMYPIIAGNGNLQFTAKSTGGIIVPTIMFNVELPYFFQDV